REGPRSRTTAALLLLFTIRMPARSALRSFRFCRRSRARTVVAALGEVALAIGEAQALFAQVGVGDVELDLAELPVARLVGRRVGDQVLRAQLLLNLREGRAQVFLILGEVGAPARVLGDFLERGLFDAVEVCVADADGVDDGVGLQGSVNRLLARSTARSRRDVRDVDERPGRLARGGLAELGAGCR